MQDIRIDLMESGKNLDSQRLKNLMQFGDTREPSENPDGPESNGLNLNNNGPTGSEMIIIN